MDTSVILHVPIFQLQDPIVYKNRILLICVLRTHIKPSIFENIFLKIEKIVNTFLIFKKIFSNISGLMCALRAHINGTHKNK